MMNGRRAFVVSDFARDSSASFGFGRFVFGCVVFCPLIISCGSFAIMVSMYNM